MKRPGINRLLDLQQLILDFARIERQIDMPGRGRLENDAEHSYDLALIAWYLSEYFPELDRDKLIRFGMAHDLVELHAGDTYFYADDDTLNSKKAREREALDRLAKEWPDFPDLLQTIEAYESRQSPEAKFIYALDKILPIMVIYLGKGYTWHKKAITHQQLHTAKLPKVSVSPEILDYYHQLHALLLNDADLFPRPSKET